ncbi:GroES-like protein [Rhodotorula sp. JG-1b]|nr:GroES-like protein [Rhodotorula sp. JG-1b]
MASLTVPKVATAVVFDQHKGPLRVERKWPIVEPEVGEVLVKIAYSGVCHSDLHAWHGDWADKPKLPLIGGHEGAGHVVAIGKGTKTKLKIGDAVGIKWLATACLDYCEDCLSGNEGLCAEQKASGYDVDGTFQQYAISDARYVTPIPEGLALEIAAPLLCAGTNTKPGNTVVISGASGGLGHLGTQYALAIGLRVVAIDSGGEKRKMLEAYGVKDFIDFKDFADEQALIEEVRRVSGGRGPHASVVFSAAAAAYNHALKYLRPRGTLVCVGLPAGAELKADIYTTVCTGLRIVGSNIGNRQDAIEALEFAARGQVMPQITVEPLENLESVFDRMERGAIAGRIVLDCQA